MGTHSLIATTAAVLLATGLARADPVRVEAIRQGDGAQVLLAWPAPVSLSSETRDGRLYVSFDRPVESDLWAIRTLSRFTGLPTVSEDGKSLTFPLQRQVHAAASVEGSKVVIKFNPKTQARIAPAHQAQALPKQPAADQATAGKVKVSTGQHAGFTRVVFDWPEPVGYSIEGAPGQVTVLFDRHAEFDARQFKRKNLKYLQGGETEGLDDSTKVTLKVPAGSSFRHMRENHKVVVEILAPPKSTKTEASATVADPPAQTQSAERSPQQVADAHLSPAFGATEPHLTPPNPPAGESTATSLKANPPLAQRETQETSLRFTWDRQVAAAVFRRGEMLWCIFDAPSQQDVAALATVAGPGVRVQQQPHDMATVLSFSGEAGLAPRLEREGTAWILRLGADEPAGAGGQSITPLADFSAAAGPRLLLPVPEPGAPVAVADPEIGDTLIVVPVMPLSSRMAATRMYPQFHLLASLQGIVVQPLIDTLRVRSLRDGVELTSLDRLVLSPPNDGSPAARLPAAAIDTERLLDTRDWMEGPAASFAARRQALEREAMRSVGADRERNRLRLAQFLLGHRFSAEALGVLTLAAEQRPDLAQEPKFLLLRGAAQLLSGRNSQAREDLARAAAGSGDEARMWAAAAGVVVGEAPQDLSRLAQWTAITAGYPAQLREPLSVLLAEVAIDGGVGKEAGQLIDAATAEAKTDETRAQVAYLQGVRKQIAGDVEGALASFAQAARMDPRRGRARAELARTLLLRQQDRLSLEQAIAALEGLRFAWRGDVLEYRLLRELGRLYLQAGDYPAGLRTLKIALSDFPGVSDAAETTADMTRAFQQLFLEGAAEKLSPVTALALYEEFKELTPAGDKGSEMVRRLAERLLQVDLLGQAASLLEGLLPRASQPEKARLGAQLAETRLRDGKPDAALADLRRTATTDASSDLQRQRALLQARALGQLGRSDEALQAISRDGSVDAELLRANLHRGRGEWDRTAAALRRVLERARVDPAAALSEQQGREVLDVAVALTLAGSDAQLAELDREYGAAMAGTPLKDAFRLIAGGGAPAGADPAALADMVQKAMAFRKSLGSTAATPSSR